jgi:mycothiol system anti-sigma-R factor
MNNPTNPFAKPDQQKPTCMEMLQTILDGQATEEQKQYFKVHMDHCMPCYKSYDLDMSLKQLLQSKCCGGAAPSDLIEKIKQQIEQKSS